MVVNEGEGDKMSIDQKTVIDALGRPLHDLRLSVTDRCNSAAEAGVSGIGG